MTTYELPDEPPIGSRVRDRDGTIWVRSADDETPWQRVSGGSFHRWAAIMAAVSPLTLIEPDPWPTAPLIVATANGQRCILHRGSAAYRDIEDFSAYFPESPDTLTNVVSVTVVPVAELAALREDLRAWDEEGFALLSDSVRKLIAATDALGVDL